MKRIPEPELMDSPAQAGAYAEADFSDANSLFTEQFLDFAAPGRDGGRLLDLGCGPADICIRLAHRLPSWRIVGLDAGPTMLRHAHRAVREAGLDERIRLHRAHLPDHGLHEQHYHAVISNSLLHHLPDPKTLWASIRTLGRPGAVVCVMDLERPDTQQAARDIVTREASDAPAVLQEDFYNSLLAAYTVEEVHRQLESAGLDTFEIIRPSDRHWLVRGRLPD